MRRGLSVRPLAPPTGLSQHPDEHSPQRPVLLAVDQEFGKGAALWVAPELADPVGAIEVGQHEDVEKFGAASGARASRRARSRRSSSSGRIGEPETTASPCGAGLPCRTARSCFPMPRSPESSGHRVGGGTLPPQTGAPPPHGRWERCEGQALCWLPPYWAALALAVGVGIGQPTSSCRWLLLRHGRRLRPRKIWMAGCS
jgi:hypothetical protein